MKVFLNFILLFLLPSSIAAQPENPHLSSLYRSLSNATSDTARMEAYSNLGSYYTLEDRDSSSFYLEKALPIAVRLDLKLNQASILNSMGIIQMQLEKFSKSLKYYLEAINIAKDPAIEKTIWHLSHGQSPTSARMLVLSKSYDLIGLLNAYSGNWIDNINNQFKNYRESEKYAKAAGDSGQIATILFHMGISYLNAGKLDSALIFIKKAQSIFTDLKDPQLGRSMIYLGQTYERMGNFNLAAKQILQAIALLNETNDYVHRGLGCISLSRVYGNSNRIDSALYYAKEGLKIFEKRNDAAWKRDAYNLITSYFDQLGKTDSSIVYLKLAKSLTDSLSAEVRKNLLAFQEVVVDEQVKVEKLEKEKIETREKARIYLLMSGIAVFTIIVLLLYRNNRVRRKTNKMLRQRNETIETTLHQLRSTQTQLIQSEKMASLGELTAGIAHEIQNPLNFVNNFSELNKELIGDLKSELTTVNNPNAGTIAKAIEENEEKIFMHGKRAEAIVKGMLMHSRGSAGKKELTDINQLADEYLRLAYQGFRAKDKFLSSGQAGFNAKCETNLDPSLPKIYIVPQDIGRVILNLLNNAFYAVSEKAKVQVTGYKPVVTLSTSGKNGKVEISVKDNGPGIPDAIRDKIFQPFFTTKPTGQGTGLGLSLSYDIIKAHGGELTVKSKEKEGTEFLIHLPEKSNS